MDKLFVASLSNYFDNKNKKISKTPTIPALFQKPQSPLQTIFSKYQTEHGRKSTATKNTFWIKTSRVPPKFN